MILAFVISFLRLSLTNFAPSLGLLKMIRGDLTDENHHSSFIMFPFYECESCQIGPIQLHAHDQ